MAVGCSGSSPSSELAAVQGWTLTPAAGSVDTGPASMGPYLTSSPRGVVLSWLEMRDASATLRFAERAADGRWTPPQSVSSGTDWFVSEVDVPSVLRLADGSLVAQWLKAVDLATEAYDVRLATSRDDGRTWSAPFAPHHDGTSTQHGFVSMFEWPSAQGGGLGMVWLDGRAMAPAPKGPGSDEMGLYMARFDASGKQTEEASLNARVCECCPTSVALSASGPVVAFRDRGPDEVRDIHVMRFDASGWAPPTAVHADGWKLDSCPVNGPAVAASGDRVAVAWWSAPGDDGHAFVAFSADRGRTFGQAIRVDDVASLGHVGVVLLDDGSAIVTWIEFGDDGARLRARRVGASGSKSAAQQLAGGNGRYVSGIPRVARAGSTLVFAWTESRGEEPGAAQQVVTATAPLLPAGQ
jgi:hypothetical protein